MNRCKSRQCLIQTNNKRENDLIQRGVHFTFGALWPIGAWGPRRDLIAKRMICLLTKMNSSTNT